MCKYEVLKNSKPGHKVSFWDTGTNDPKPGLFRPYGDLFYY